ncbi:MAG: TrkA family potassium uptake protein, partial [Candidatus Cloacimonetes bacterium]|nr:TrkA family potassium uptake protein [Candidatus Cloacimonadota bacterium]
GVNIIAIKYNSLSVTEDGRNVVEKKMNDMPGANDTINEGDILIMMGPKGNVDKLIYDTTIRKD